MYIVHSYRFMSLIHTSYKMANACAGFDGKVLDAANCVTTLPLIGLKSPVHSVIYKQFKKLELHPSNLYSSIIEKHYIPFIG